MYPSRLGYSITRGIVIEKSGISNQVYQGRNPIRRRRVLVSTRAFPLVYLITVSLFPSLPGYAWERIS